MNDVSIGGSHDWKICQMDNNRCHGWKIYQIGLFKSAGYQNDGLWLSGQCRYDFGGDRIPGALLCVQQSEAPDFE